MLSVSPHSKPSVKAFYNDVAIKNVDNLNLHSANIAEMSTNAVTVMKNILAALRSIKYNERALEYSAINNMSTVNKTSLKILKTKEFYTDKVNDILQSSDTQVKELHARLNQIKKTINNPGSVQVLINIRDELTKTLHTVKRMRDGLVRPAQNLNKITSLFNTNITKSLTVEDVIIDPPIVIFMKLDNLIKKVNNIEISNGWMFIYIPLIHNILSSYHTANGFNFEDAKFTRHSINHDIIFAEMINGSAVNIVDPVAGETVVQYTLNNMIQDANIDHKNKEIGDVINNFLLTYKHKIMAVATNPSNNYAEKLKWYSFPMVEPKIAHDSLRVAKINKPTTLLGMGPDKTVYNVNGDVLSHISGDSFDIINNSDKKISVVDYSRDLDGGNLLKPELILYSNRINKDMLNPPKKRNMIEYEYDKDEPQSKVARGDDVDSSQKAIDVYTQCVNYSAQIKKYISDVSMSDSASFISSVINFESALKMLNSVRGIFPSKYKGKWLASNIDIETAIDRISLIDSEMIGKVYDSKKFDNYKNILIHALDIIREAIKLKDYNPQVAYVRSMLYIGICEEIENYVRNILVFSDEYTRIFKQNTYNKNINESDYFEFPISSKPPYCCKLNLKSNIILPRDIEQHFRTKYNAEFSMYQYNIDRLDYKKKSLDHLIAVCGGDHILSDILMIKNYDPVLIKRFETSFINLIRAALDNAGGKKRVADIFYSIETDFIVNNSTADFNFELDAHATTIKNEIAVGNYYEEKNEFVKDGDNCALKLNIPLKKWMTILEDFSYLSSLELLISGGVFSAFGGDTDLAVEKLNILAYKGVVFSKLSNDPNRQSSIEATLGFKFNIVCESKYLLTNIDIQNMLDIRSEIVRAGFKSVSEYRQLLIDQEQQYISGMRNIEAAFPKTLATSSRYAACSLTESSYRFINRTGADIQLESAKPVEIKAWGPSGSGKSTLLYGLSAQSMARTKTSGVDALGIIQLLINKANAGSKNVEFSVYDWHSAAFPFLSNLKDAIANGLTVNYYLDKVGGVKSKVVKTFGDLVPIGNENLKSSAVRQSIELVRKTSGHISSTSNNPESSRSFLFFFGHEKFSNVKILNDPPGQENPILLTDGQHYSPGDLALMNCAFLNPVATFFNTWHDPGAFFIDALLDFQDVSHESILNMIVNISDGNTVAIRKYVSDELKLIWGDKIDELLTRLGDYGDSVKSYLDSLPTNFLDTEIKISAPDLKNYNNFSTGDKLRFYGISKPTITLRELINGASKFKTSNPNSLIDILTDSGIGSFLNSRVIGIKKLGALENFIIKTSGSNVKLTLSFYDEDKTTKLLSSFYNHYEAILPSKSSSTNKFEIFLRTINSSTALMVTYPNISTLIFSIAVYKAIFLNPKITIPHFFKLGLYLGTFLPENIKGGVLRKCESVVINDVVGCNMRSGMSSASTVHGAVSKIIKSHEHNIVSSFEELLYDTCLIYSDVSLIECSTCQRGNAEYPKYRYVISNGKDFFTATEMRNNRMIEPLRSRNDPDTFLQPPTEPVLGDSINTVEKSLFPPSRRASQHQSFSPNKIIIKPTHGHEVVAYSACDYDINNVIYTFFIELEKLLTSRRGYSNTRLLGPETEVSNIVFAQTTPNASTNFAQPYMKPEIIKKIDFVIFNAEKAMPNTGLSNYIDIFTDLDCP